MKIFTPGYYILERPKQGKWSRYLKDTSLLFSWALSFVIRRPIISIAFGPNDLKFQNRIHPLYLSDDRAEKGAVILNILSGKSSKSPKNYFNKMPRFSSKTKRQLSFDNPKHKKQVDSIIDEIGLLLEGKCTHDKCQNKRFAIEDIHIKGIERLDMQLAHYFKEQVNKKYGRDFFERARKAKLDFYTLETADNALLESVAVSTAEEQNKPLSERKFIISCMARNQNYIYWLKDFYTSAKNIGCSVIGFNYRGNDYSKGIVLTHGNMIDDALAQAQRLIEQGVKPENIAFEGMSMGGAVATIAAARMHDKGYKVYLYNERSYRTLARKIEGIIMPNPDSNLLNPFNWLRYAAVALTYVLFSPLIYLTGWHLDAASAWNRIPFEFKSYAVARNHQNPKHYDDDDLIHDSYASIASLIDQRVKKIKHKKGTTLSLEEQQLLADKPESHQFTLDRDNKTNTNPSSHAAPRRFLFGTHTHKQTLHHHMIDSVQKMFYGTATKA